jgi:hypothetical protein
MEGNNQHRVGHEESDVNALAVGKFAIALALIAISSLVLLFGLFRYFQSRETAGQTAPSEYASQAGKVPPEPRLQPAPVADLQAIRAAEDQVLNSYGWVDSQKGVVRIPIARAIDLLAQRGLPSRPQGEAQNK